MSFARVKDDFSFDLATGHRTCCPETASVLELAHPAHYTIYFHLGYVLLRTYLRLVS